MQTYDIEADCLSSKTDAVNLRLCLYCNQPEHGTAACNVQELIKDNSKNIRYLA